MEDRGKEEFVGEGGYGVLDAGELDYLLSDPELREIIEALEREAAGDNADNDEVDGKKNYKVE